MVTNDRIPAVPGGLSRPVTAVSGWAAIAPRQAGGRGCADRAVLLHSNCLGFLKSQSEVVVATRATRQALYWRRNVSDANPTDAPRSPSTISQLRPGSSPNQP